MGRLRQAVVPWTGASVAVSGALYPPRSHLQPPHSQRLGWTSHLPMEGLRPRRQAAEHDAYCQRVPAPVPATRSAKRLHSHSLFRLPRSATPWRSITALPSVVGGPSRAMFTANASAIAVSVSAMRRSVETHRAATRSPTPAQVGLLP